MTRKEFERLRMSIEEQDFFGNCTDPIEYGIQRARFEEKKLRKLIVLADQTAFSTAKRKVAGWRRQLERVQQIQTRLESRKKESPMVSRDYNQLARAAAFHFVNPPRSPIVTAR